jgi:hypothetical protein
MDGSPENYQLKPFVGFCVASQSVLGTVGHLINDLLSSVKSFTEIALLHLS